jgi:hypothetical protein
MVAATVCTPGPSRPIRVNQGVDAAPRTFKRIVFRIFDLKQLDLLDEVLPAGRDSALHALVEG